MLVAAFADEPMVRWFLPADDLYPSQARAFFETLFDLRLAGGEVWVTEAAVALWDPPGGNRLPDSERQARWAGIGEVIGPLEAARIDRHEEAVAGAFPDRPHWYLGVVGVRPGEQGKGWARTVLVPVLDRCDREGIPAGLETTGERNLAVYRRLGFEVVAEMSHPDGPTVSTMWREPAP